MGLGELLYDHYEKYFKKLTDRTVFDGNEESKSIQVLEYGKVVKGCKVFASLGLTHFNHEVSSLCEVVVVVDDGYKFVPNILANALFYAVENRIRITDGGNIRGIKNIDKEFYLTFKKDCLYFTEPYCFPEGFYSTNSNKFPQVDLYLGVFLSDDEASYLRSLGVDKFENLLESSNVDLFNIKRQSII